MTWLHFFGQSSITSWVFWYAKWVQLFSFVHHSLLINNDNCCRANSDSDCSFLWQEAITVSLKVDSFEFLCYQFSPDTWFSAPLIAKSIYCVIKSGFTWFFCHRFYFWLMSFTSCSWTCISHYLHCTYANTEKEHLASSRNQSRWLNKWCYSNFNKL